jgi:organic radical activating enzyme
MIKSGIKEFIENDILFSYWIITRNCNYNCKYCPSPNLSKIMSDKLINLTIEKYNQLEQIKPVNLIITGGEPTLNNLNDILSRLILSRPITLFTNLSMSTEYYLNLNSIHKIKLYCSHHPSQMLLTEFIEKINALADSIEITAKFMIINSNDINQIENTKSLINPLINIEVLLVNNNFTTNTDQLNVLNTYTPFIYGDELLSLQDFKQKNNFKGWNCSSPGNNICIDYIGNVYNCKAHFQRNLPLPFTIEDPNFIDKYLQLNPNHICNLNNCTSEPEIYKWKE